MSRENFKGRLTISLESSAEEPFQAFRIDVVDEESGVNFLGSV